MHRSILGIKQPTLSLDFRFGTCYHIPISLKTKITRTYSSFVVSKCPAKRLKCCTKMTEEITIRNHRCQSFEANFYIPFRSILLSICASFGRSSLMSANTAPYTCGVGGTGNFDPQTWSAMDPNEVSSG